MFYFFCLFILFLLSLNVFDVVDLGELQRMLVELLCRFPTLGKFYCYIYCVVYY